MNQMDQEVIDGLEGTEAACEKYERLDAVDRQSAETLQTYFQANPTTNRCANQLANLFAWQSLAMGATLAFADYVLLYLTLLVSDGLTQQILPSPDLQLGNSTLLFSALLIIPIANAAGLYPGIGQSAVMEFRQSLWSLIAAISTIFGIGIFFLPGNILYYLAFSFIALVTVPFVLTIRFLVRKIARLFRLWGVPTLIVAEPERGMELFRRISNTIDRGFRPVGILLSPENYWSGSRLLEENNIPAFDIRRTEELATALGVTWVIVSPCGNRDCSPASDASLTAIPNKILLSSEQLDIGLWDELFCVASTTGIRLGAARPNFLQLACKRLLDLSMTIMAIAIGFPVLLLFGFLIKLSSRGPILYGQKRVGRYGKAFTAWKFRSMLQNADAVLDSYLEQNPEAKAEWDLKHKLSNDPRVTKIGAFLRSTSLDELPQLWNVLRGEMSLVGPRPIVDSPTYDAAYIHQYPDEYEVYKSVRPGLTGLWQVSSRSNGVYELRVYWDMYYIRNWSISLDLYLIFRTVKTVVFREGAT